MSLQIQHPYQRLFPALLILLLAVSVTSIAVGQWQLGWLVSLQSLTPWQDQLAPHVLAIVQQVRLPRTLLCLFVGALLAVCGALMQGLFRNPLADPGIIGVSGGASLGGALGLLLLSFGSINLAFHLSVPLFAFFGALLATLFVYRIGTTAMGTSVTVMLLAGIAISALSGAALGMINYVADNQTLRDIALWSMGSLTGASWGQIGLTGVAAVALTVFAYCRAHQLNALLLGENEAAYLGIDIHRLKRLLIIATAAGMGISVSAAGLIGFIGLVVPHIGRLLAGPDHRMLIPLSAVLGALLLTLADIIARVIVAPAELPVGIITALMGAPFFIWLLIQQRQTMVH
ncbi:iron ABC transporter permease [Salinivibrio kushneri]|uniref:Iron ABC transporter permease n=1 Tax=Salinivibrio kushneri TaxID=1908198 RepID=A0AB36K7N5_9GAMM|nr:MULTISPECIES: iron ABC transporter permease [Salinivibrio]ODP98817.1 iron ABC transporter permease [Salinivibrio sp. BNH]OOE44741.1 iron ABC transporter permease [Salinivibrio kushneri]OOE47801.1 iron ABC transporter permease [Salinivibrio kushneri]OOE71402.1 iron ABC transporter permease [Salinivibrio kushneri]